MAQVLLYIVGVLLLCVTALGALWLAGQLLLGMGALLTGAAGVLLRLIWFALLALLSGGVAYFIAHAWRPGKPVMATPMPVSSASPARSGFWSRRPATPEKPATSEKVVIGARPEVTTASKGNAEESPQPTDPSDG